MELKDKLNLLWKYLFLAVFTYAIISITCCKNSCSYRCGNQSGQLAPCQLKNLPNKQPCGPGCIKPCCAKTGR